MATREAFPGVIALHMAVHTAFPSVEFKCTHEGCSSGFRLKADLTEHQATHSDDSKPVYAVICDSALRCIARVASAEPFKCAHEGCTEAFKQDAALKAHAAVHAPRGEATDCEGICAPCCNTRHPPSAPITCVQCGATFSVQSDADECFGNHWR